jgi:hypothetical protein
MDDVLRTFDEAKDDTTLEDVFFSITHADESEAG